LRTITKNRSLVFPAEESVGEVTLYGDGVTSYNGKKTQACGVVRLRRGQVAELVVRNGVDMSFLENCDPTNSLREIHFNGTDLNDDEVEWLSSLQGLTCLNLGYTQISNVGLERVLPHLPGLKKLLLSSTFISDLGLRYIGRLSGLEELLCWKTGITDAGLRHLETLASMQRLGLNHTKITDRGLTSLQHMPMLRELGLNGNRITADGLSYIEKMTSLQELDLNQTMISDDGLEHLSGLTALTVLDIRRTEIGDAGARYLENLPALKRLHCFDTKITSNGKRRLQQALPNCEIYDHR